jgi:thiamine-phosphate pyrophosphorylase
MADQRALLLPPLYPIIDPDALLGRSPVDAARAVVAGGGRLIQLRVKDRPSAETLAVAEALRAITSSAGAKLVINDRVDVALAVGADAVHLGADDLPVDVARRLLGPHVLIGRSTHSLDEAIAAVSAGADYIGFGPMFSTTTKVLTYAPQGLERLRCIRARVGIPIVAIGGITQETAPAVLAAGANAAAMIGEIGRASDIEATVRRLVAALR